MSLSINIIRMYCQPLVRIIKEVTSKVKLNLIKTKDRGRGRVKFANFGKIETKEIDYFSIDYFHTNSTKNISYLQSYIYNLEQ